MTAAKYLNGVKIPSNSNIANKYELNYQNNLSPHSFNVIDYEGGIIKAQEKACSPGDEVVIVGGGYGITTVKPAQLVGDSGKVTVYEGGNKQMKTLNEVLDINGVKHICNSNQAVVGEELGVYSDTTDSRSITPGDIPTCDVLELDCEGSELDILKNMKINPGKIIIELHPWEYPDEMLEPINILKNRGYEICYRWGHDGIQIDESGFKSLMKKSRERLGEHDVEKTSDKYLECGARWPVVATAVLQ